MFAQVRVTGSESKALIVDNLTDLWKYRKSHLVTALSLFDQFDYFLGRLLFIGDCQRLFHVLGTDQLNVSIFIVVHLKDQISWHFLWSCQTVRNYKDLDVVRTALSNVLELWGVRWVLPILRRKWLSTWSAISRSKSSLVETDDFRCRLSGSRCRWN